MSPKPAARPAPRRAVPERSHAHDEVQALPDPPNPTPAKSEPAEPSPRDQALSAAYALQRSDKVSVNVALSAHAATVVRYLESE